MKQVQTLRLGSLVRLVVYGVLLILFLGLLVRQHDSIAEAIRTVRQADIVWLGAGVLAMGLSLPATAVVYTALTPQRLLFGRTVLVQTAGFCVNKLLPSGSGAVGTSYLYLRANKVPGVQAGAIVTLNNLLGVVGHFVLFWLLIALQPATLHTITLRSDKLRTGLALAAYGLLAVIGLAIILRRRLAPIMHQLRPLFYRRRGLAAALAGSMLITLCYVLSLYASAQAVGLHINLAEAIIVLSASVLATSVVPAPGGIGAAEAGAYGGLVVVGSNHQAALAAAILYRVCTFWLPLIVGSVAFGVVVKRGYLQTGR